MLLESLVADPSLQTQLKKMASYWIENHKQEHGVAYLEKKDLRPEMLLDVIPYLTLSEFLSNNEMRIRLSGTEVDRLSEGNLKDRNLFEIVPLHMRDNFIEFMKLVKGHQFGYVSTREKTSALGQKTVLKTLGLPLKEHLNGGQLLVTVYQITHDSVALNGDEIVDLFANNEAFGFQLYDIGNGLPDIDDKLIKALNIDL